MAVSMKSSTQTLSEVQLKSRVPMLKFTVRFFGVFDGARHNVGRTFESVDGKQET